MATTSLNTDRKPSVSKGTSGKCRFYKARTTLVVKRATSTVMTLFPGLQIVSFTEPIDSTCISLYKAVKKYLAVEISDDPEVQMAFQSIKKLLPDACKCMHGTMLDDLRNRLTRTPPRLSPEYLTHCRSVLSEIFTDGWDKPWGAKTKTFSPSLGSCTENGRSKGGQLSTLAEAGQDSWINSLTEPKGELKGELLLVNSSGKPRSLTRFEAQASALRPLHGLLYDKLSQTKWLLRGDVTKQRLREAGFSGKGGSLISGDYVSASDNLPIEVAELILDFCWSKSRYVPAAVWRYALAAQRPELKYESSEGLVETFVPTLGQMMGSYLCFPLLCLQNYLAFRWACTSYGVDVPAVLINGDDILFQEPRKGFFDHWRLKVEEVGLEVELSKTSCSDVYGSINSTLVKWWGGKLRVVKTFRMGMLRSPDHPSNMGASFEDFSRVGPKANWYRNGMTFLGWHVRTIIQWFGSPQEMGFFGGLAKSCWRRFMKGALWTRECLRKRKNIPTLDPAPCPHSIIMRSTEFVSVDPSKVDQTGQGMIAAWMAARKWELGRTYKREKARKILKDRQLSLSNNQISSNVFNSAGSLRSWLKKEGVEGEDRRRVLWAPPSSLHSGLYVGHSQISYKPLAHVEPRVVGYEIPDQDVWRRRVKSTDVRVPVPLLEELGLKVTVPTPREIVGWCDRGRYTKGAKMLYSRVEQNVRDFFEVLPFMRKFCLDG